MPIIKEIKEQIDEMSYEQLLDHWRFDPPGTLLFQGENGDYFKNRMNELRSKSGGQEEHIRSSKSIGWDK